MRGNNYLFPGGSDCNDANDKIAGPFWAGIGDVTLTYPVVIGGWATNADGTSINGDYPCPPRPASVHCLMACLSASPQSPGDRCGLRGG